ncbi:S8 family serine peptidase [bacterium]|nr:S8 family serine peptidase [bacterium]
MKKILFTILAISLCSLSLFAEKVYRSDGSFFELKRNEGVYALKLDRVSVKAPENYVFKWSHGDQMIVLQKDSKGNLPVYFVNGHMVVADSILFYRGDKPADFIAKKYNLKVSELVSGYDYIEFDGASDSVKTAQQIVENGDGFAFPNIIRRTQLLEKVVKYPVEDKYYKENYQWSLKNTGKGINAYGKEIDTLENADVRFDDAIRLISEKIDAGELENFEVAKVAIMDSGVDFAHPDLKNKLEDGYNMVHEGETGNPGKIENTGMYGTSGYSHGTNCAGVAAAEGNEIGTAGICPWCGIYPVTYMEGGMGTQESSSDKKLMTAYTKYVEDPSIVAINCSFGPMSGFGDIPASQGEIESHMKFIKEGRNGKGGAIVYASGNDGVDASYTGILTYKFEFEREGKQVSSSVITVGASSAWDTRVRYSNYGSMIDVVAPSLSMNPLIGIATSYLVGYGDLDKDYTNQFSGTSSAAPVITGAFGTIFSVNPELTLEEAIEILHKSSDKVNPSTGFYDENGHSVKFGYGRLNLLKAVRLAAGLEMCEASGEEIKNNLDDNCDGRVDEGFEKDISKVGGKCSENADCANADFAEENVKCLTGEYKKYNFADGYCVIKNNKFACPDGTEAYEDSQTSTDCFLECNKENPCPAGMACTDDTLGICIPECKEDTDCNQEIAYCDTKSKLCKNVPSEPLGPCETVDDCKYNAMMCLDQIPDGLCVVMCNNDYACNDDEDNMVNKCVKFSMQGYQMDICTPGCESDSDCRSFGYGYGMVCHKNYNDKGAVCAMPCERDRDCMGEDAKCLDSKCVPLDYDGEEETDSDAGSDVDVIASDADSADDMNFDDDPEPEKDKDKKSSGCSLSLF